LQIRFIVIPANAGIYLATSRCSTMDPGFRRDDDRNAVV
jgi:hypothetical protein